METTVGVEILPKSRPSCSNEEDANGENPSRSGSLYE